MTTVRQIERLWNSRSYERICRDLSTYLRQPAADEVLTEAADWFARHPAASVQ